MELKELHAMLVETTGIVEKQITAGKSLAEIKAAGLDDKWKNWSAPTLNADRWVEIIYGSLSLGKSGRR